LIDEFLIELGVRDFWNIALPPIGLIASVMKADAAELTRVGKDERALALIQDQMVVFDRAKVRRRNMCLAGHPEMNAEPVVPGKSKEYAFASRGRGQKVLAP
jgi:hypothetical protein